jgi:arylsulfatase A-like enzyme
MPQFLDPSVHTLPKLLHGAGYTTAHIGKWHLGHSPKAPAPSVYGFDHVRACTSNADTWKEQNDDPYFRAKSTAIFVDEAVKFLEANRDKPFYLQLWTLLPHATLNPTDEQLKPFLKYSPQGGKFPHRSAKTIYAASVADLDTQIGRLMAKLSELKLADNTIVLFSSDNGPEAVEIGNASHSAFGSTGVFRGRKRSLYEGGIRVPFIVRGPGVPVGRVDDRSVLCAADVLPSLCTMTNTKRPADFVGTAADRKQPIFWEWRYTVAGPVLDRSPILAVRDGKWKLLFNPDGSRTELYDIPRDPSELQNEAARQPEVVTILSTLAKAWQKSFPAGPLDGGAGKANYPWPKNTP